MKAISHLFFIIIFCVVFATTASAAIFTNLYSFSPSTFNNPAVAGANGGSLPQAALLSWGNVLYGTTVMGGSNNIGTVFANGGATTIHTFSGPDGATPESDLAAYSNILFGTTSGGGTYGGGTLFAVNTNGTGFTNLFNFAFTNGANPEAGVLLAGSTLYGTTSKGGLYGAGTVFAISTNGTGFTTLYNFDYTNGANPQADLLLAGNMLYGTTPNGGGSSDWGTIFAINTNGTGFTNLFTFNLTNGANPVAGLAFVSNSLCGTTEDGDSFGAGNVFLIGTNGSGFCVLHSFGSSNEDGLYPFSRLAVSSNGVSSYSLYGTTFNTGPEGAGIAFQLNLSGPDLAFSSYTVLNDLNPGMNLVSSSAGLILTNGVLYGTASTSLQNTGGGVFSINTFGGYGYTTIHTFARTVPNNTDVNLFTNRDGAESFAGLASSGRTLYGTTTSGGVNGNGTIFAIDTDGTGFTNLCSLGGTDAGPWASLTISGQTLYGLATSSQDFGDKQYFSFLSSQIFSLNTDGTGFTNLADLGDDAGASSGGNLLLSDGVLYDTTSVGGSDFGGVLFAVTTNGTGFTNLYNFDYSTGAYPSAGLIQSGQTLYGTTVEGGNDLNGTIFAINTDGTGFTNLLLFNGTNGSGPQATLTLSGNKLYGTTTTDVIRGFGTVFAMNTDGTGFTNLYIFSGYDGAVPLGNLVVCGNTLYGTTYKGGSGGYGTVFAINTDGTGFTNLYSFSGDLDGGNPYDGLLLSGNTLYGTTYEGGSGGNGTVFALSLGPIPLGVEPAGTNVVLTWGNPAFSLQSAPNVYGPYTTILSAASPYTNAVTGSQEFFRLQSL